MGIRKKINGKIYKYYASSNTLSEAKKRAKVLRERDNVFAAVKKDERPFAKTFHVYFRKK